MSVISKVDEKVKSIIDKLPEGYSEEDFLKAFKEEYPKDYQKCWSRFLKEERASKPGKPHPMQHPDKHIKNALRSYLSRKLKNKGTMKMNYLKYLCAILFAAIGLTANAYDFEVDGIYYNILSEEDRTVEITYNCSGYICTPSAEGVRNLVIPQRVTSGGRTYTVAVIGPQRYPVLSRQ